MCNARSSRLRASETAAVNLMTGEATVAFDPEEVGADALVEAIVDTGYEAQLPAAGPQRIRGTGRTRARASRTEARELAIKAIVSLALGAIAMFLSMRCMHEAWRSIRLAGDHRVCDGVGRPADLHRRVDARRGTGPPI